jgi:maltokinase
VSPDSSAQPDIRDLDPAVFASFLEKTRWFGGKGRPFAVTAVRRIDEVPGRDDEGPHVGLLLAEVTYDDVPEGAVDRIELYQVPLAFYSEPEDRLQHAFVGWWEEPGLGWVHAYDAVHDRRAMACWLRSFGAAAEGPVTSPGGLTFHRLPGYDLDQEAHSALFSGEQSNSSVAFGEDSLMKVFRKVTPGPNPDVAVHEVLTRAGSEHVAALYGWLDAEDPATGSVLQLAMLSQFLRTATDGWDLALSSVRNLFSEGDLHAYEVGGDFAGEATRLGEALREVHATLRASFPSERRGPTAARELAETMGRRLDAALLVVPELAEHADALRATFSRVAELPGLDVQQVHGDLHLGQTLRTSLGWKIVDFEGEPAKPLAERLLPDSPWRDVAGMLRSFDYAPHVVERTHSESDEAGRAQRAVRSEEWSNRNKNHFLVAYAGGQLGDDQRVLLDAYVADKAVYETVYETRNRPGWVPIPLEAIARIGAS